MQAPHEIALGEAGAHDIYLAPHSDDACFSLGHLARQRGRGILLTVFSQSIYTAASPPDPQAAARVTRLRMTEDARFAQHCGLEPEWLRLRDAQMRGLSPFDLSQVQQGAALVRDPLLRALAGATLGLVLEPKPWLFCPSGIGGHVDHVALAWVVTRHWRELAARFRIAFYEDLHYASNPKRRAAGIERLHALLPRAAWSRLEVPMTARDARAKLSMVRIYSSQMEPKIDRIESFTPAVEAASAPHEALWIPQAELHQREG